MALLPATPAPPAAAPPSAAGAPRGARWGRRVLSVAGPLLVAVAVSGGLEQLSGNVSVPFPVFSAGAIAAAWLGGLGPGLVYTGLAVPLLGLLFVQPRGTLVGTSPGDALLLAAFMVVGVLISSAVSALRAGRQRAEALQQMAVALGRVGSLPELADVARAQAQRLLGAEQVGLWLAPEAGGAAPVAAGCSPAQGVELLAPAALLALRTGAPVWPGTEPGSRAEPGPGPVLALPLRSVPEQVTGALVLRLAQGRRLGRRQRELALALAEACAAVLERSRLQQRLLEERRLLDSVLVQAPVGVIVAEAPGGRVFLYNAASEQLLGHPVIPSANVSEYAAYGGLRSDGTPVDVADYPTARAVRGETVRDELMRYRRGDGQEVFLQISAAPVRGPDGALSAAVCVFTDVSERQRAQAQLRQSEERYRQLFEAAPQIIWTNRPDGSDTRFNARWEELTGQGPGEVAGTGWQQIIHPEDRPRLRAQRAEGIRLEQPYAVEFRVRTREGPYHWLLAQVKPLRDAAGRIETWLGVAVDIHARKQGEVLQGFLAGASATLSRALGEREVLEEAVRLAVPELADWCVVDLNAPGGLQRVALRHADPAMAPHLEVLRAHRPRPGSASPVLEVFRTGRTALLQPYPESTYRHQVQSDAHLEAVRALAPQAMVVVPLLARERVLGTLVLARAAGRDPFGTDDVGLAEDFGRRCGLALDNARLLTELQRSLQTRDDFLSSVAHDLRNPLSVVSMRAALLRSEVERRGSIVPERITAAAARITAASDEMASMVESLVDLMRSDMGAPPTLRRTQVDLGALAREVALDQQQHGGARQHRLRLHLPDAPVHASVDEVRVRRVVRNLVSNAAKYSEEGAEIHVSAEALQQDGQPWVRLEVRDHGMGIPERDLPHLFGRFFRGENVVGRIPGTGIGLFGAQQIVEQHGGRIEVRSTEGEGSTFCVWLPVAPPSGAPQA